MLVPYDRKGHCVTVEVGGRRVLLAQDAYAPPDSGRRLWPAAVALAAAVPSSGNLLDFGCGVGLVAIEAARAGCRVTAVDRDPKALVLAVGNAAGQGVEIAAVNEVGPESFDHLFAADMGTLGVKALRHWNGLGRAVLSEAVRGEADPLGRDLANDGWYDFARMTVQVRTADGATVAVALYSSRGG